jgi:pimeloyl-ACP methyl ester carboxylesterase
MYWLRRVSIGLALLVVAVLVLGVGSIEIAEWRTKASTHITTPNGIESLEFIELGGVPQAIYLRGLDRRRPVLLFVHGGPGVPSMPGAREFGRLLEEYFVVVHWDQRGSGNSCSSEVPDESLRLEQYLADTVELVNLLRDRFDVDKIFLLGHSWGSILGVITAQRHPDLLHAYIGMGQVVDMQRNEEVSLRFVLDRARAEGNKIALEELEPLHPPYADREDLMLQRKWLGHYRGDYLKGDAITKMSRDVLLSPEYSWPSKFSFYSCAMNSLDQAWSGLKDIDFIRSADSLQVPTFFFTGRYDYNTPFELALEYYESLDAPYKEIIWFENSAHMPNLEEPKRFQEMLIERVLPIAQ